MFLQMRKKDLVVYDHFHSTITRLTKSTVEQVFPVSVEFWLQSQ